MKLIGYICLVGFVATALVSLFSLIETEFLLGYVGQQIRWHPEVGDGIAAVLCVVAVFVAIAAILSKAVGFGTPVIPHDRRGLMAAARATPALLHVLLVLSVAYAVTVYATVQPVRVKKVITGSLTNYYLYPHGDKSEKAEIISKNEYRSHKATWTRKITALSMVAYLMSGCFLLSRTWRRDPELEKLAERGMAPGQIDDSMNL